ncbi:hypothetical protein FIBSPDRAFT_894016 [Athelia psychrophila]|uniref:Uncharacterized protein n=1 Tax=Athelia psychrophila TaxID=1759441 RepID=A0A166GFD5_9AGAM|nr:hypothetical protein FIBSPDRAFT_894016 [Fibularhizoctonia sp. CBS 109695]
MSRQSFHKLSLVALTFSGFGPKVRMKSSTRVVSSCLREHTYNTIRCEKIQQIEHHVDAITATLLFHTVSLQGVGLTKWCSALLKSNLLNTTSCQVHVIQLEVFITENVTSLLSRCSLLLPARHPIPEPFTGLHGHDSMNLLDTKCDLDSRDTMAELHMITLQLPGYIHKAHKTQLSVLYTGLLNKVNHTTLSPITTQDATTTMTTFWAVPDDVQWDEGFHAEVWVPEMHLYPEWPHNLAALSIK